MAWNSGQRGVTAIIQPGGSMRDAEVIAAAIANSIAMIFTGIRHFDINPIWKNKRL